MKENMNTKEILKLAGYIILIPVIGFITSLFFEARNFYTGLNLPPLAPPHIVFPIVWVILYALLGAALYYIIRSKNTTNLILFITQLVINFLWSFVFFNFELFILSFIMILIIFVLTVMIIIYDKRLIYLLTPYLLWLIFAGYLNLGIIILN